MSDEYSVLHNFQSASDDPRAAAEYEHRMRRVAQREAELELLELVHEAAEESERRQALRRAADAATELAARRRRATMRAVANPEESER